MKVVIGAGPAGMMAAITAAREGKDVIILEKNEKVGRKLAITGKGRCNVTNACDLDELFENIRRNNRFLYSAVYGFTNTDVMNFFEDSGVKLKVERGNRVFPVSDKAWDIVDALRREMLKSGVRIVRDEAVQILTEEGHVVGVKCKNKAYPCDGVVIATGGACYRQTGSTGDGYTFAKALGHTVTPILPSLIPIVTEEDTKPLQGLSLKNVTLRVKNKNGKTIFEDLGEMLFTHFGLSGPLVLSASAHMGENVGECKISIDLKPALSEEKLDERILRDFSANINRDFANSLGGLLPLKLIPYIIGLSQIDPKTKVNTITKQQRRRLCGLLKNLEFTPASYRPLNEAIVTCGGVNVKEINPSTMESKLVKGVYFAGEVIDVDAYTGGFNLQIAFSTGHLAGQSI